MNEMLKITPIALYFIVGAISMKMAFKNLFAAKFLPFHEKASVTPWNEIDNQLKAVILSLLRLSGMGFLITALLMLVFPIVNYFNPNTFSKYAIPVMALIYCSGLFAINYRLYNKTKAKTPWKGSLYALLIILLGIIISIFS